MNGNPSVVKATQCQVGQWTRNRETFTSLASRRMMVSMKVVNRDTWLRQDDEILLRDCDEDHFRASGPGGQHRNKVETAVRLHHRPSGVLAQAVESRHREENRLKALRRLRDALAMQLRLPFDLGSPELPAEFVARRTADGKLSVSQKNPGYPLIVATALDALDAAQGSYAAAGKALGLTTSQFIRFLQADPQVWRTVKERGGHDTPSPLV